MWDIKYTYKTASSCQVCDWCGLDGMYINWNNKYAVWRYKDVLLL